MDESSPRIHSLASCYENSITTIVRLGTHQPQAIPSSQRFRNDIGAALQAAMKQARATGYSDEIIKLALAAVVAFLDESVLTLANPNYADWAERPMGLELFRNARLGEVYFENLDILLSRPDSLQVADCLEIYCVCLQLGYRGRYAIAGEGEVDTLIRRSREKMERVRGPLRFLYTAVSAPEVRQPASVDRWGRGLGFVALGLLVLMMLAFISFWWMLGSGASQAG